MNENLRSRLEAKLANLSDERARQLLDYVEFLESKYNRSSRTPSTVQRLAENIEDRIGNVRLADVATKGTAQVMEAAGKLMEGLAAASRVVAEELQVQPPARGNGDAETAAPSPETSEAAQTVAEPVEPSVEEDPTNPA